MLRNVDARRVGRSLRALRIRAGRRQFDVAAPLGVSRQLVSKVERGLLDDVQVGTVRRIGESLGASVELAVRWHGENLDRLLDEAHAGLVEQVVTRLESLGWETAVEVSFSIRGERGAIDVMGLARSTACVLVVEVKSVVPDAGSTLFTLDRKARLAPEVARDLGWPRGSVSRLLVVGESSTARRRVAALAAVFRTAFPVRGRAVVGWLARPSGSMAGLLFLPFATRGSTRQRVTGRQRVRAPRAASPRA